MHRELAIENFKCFSAKYGCTPKAYRNEKVSRIEME